MSSSKNNNSSDDLKMSDSSASKENEWVDFSSSEDESDSSDDESVAEKKVKAAKPVAKNSGGKNNKENKTKQVPRKAGKSITKAVNGARRKAAVGKAAAAAAKAKAGGPDEFGREGAHHRLQGKVRTEPCALVALHVVCRVLALILSNPSCFQVRPKSPTGRQMILSRRLSRRILKGTPLKSPM